MADYLSPAVDRVCIRIKKGDSGENEIGRLGQTEADAEQMTKRGRNE